MTTKNSTYHLLSFKGLYLKLYFAGIMILTALCVMSCRTARESTQRSQSDSLQTKEIKTYSLEAVPPSRAMMTMTPENLQLLPVGSGYYKKDGQANLVITKGENDTIFIKASCDSLQRIAYSYEQEITRLKTQLEEKVIEPPPCKPTIWQSFWIRIGQILATGVIIYLIYRKLKNSKLINSKI